VRYIKARANNLEQPHSRPRKLLDPFVGESVAACPIGALWARLALWIIGAFLMRASEDAICDYDRTHLILAEKFRDLLADESVVANVGSFGKPAFELIGLIAFIRDDGDSDLCGLVCSRSVEGNCGKRIAPESALNFLR
jgi:hypothetical protein